MSGEWPETVKARILIVDDETKMAAALATSLQRHGYQCRTCPSGLEALQSFQEEGADVVVTDRRMPGMDGIELMRRLKALAPNLPVILITAFADIPSAVQAMRQGAFDYLSKPFDNQELRTQVERALELNRLQRENRLLRRELGAQLNAGMVVESASMKAVLDLVERAAPSRAPVLIQGESGTGKELVARRLHYASDRLARPFVAVNCRAFAQGVLESELFGHEKGAFSGALSARPGCFERAHGGTLFLDEIGDIDESFQAKLLRVLQEGEVLRVGATKTRQVDVRIVSATNRELRREIHQGRFREDLFFRLNVIPVDLPPLRDRRPDVLPLARHFLARHNSESGRTYSFSKPAQERMLEYRWPGNVRELENAVERAFVLARQQEIGPEDLLLEPIGSSDQASGRNAACGTLQEAVEHAVVERIGAALQASRGHRGDAADSLGIDRTTLYRLIKRHRIRISD